MFSVIASASPQWWCLIALLAIVPLGLAVRQLAFALLKGSIFQPLRDYIRIGQREGRFGFGKLNQLFTCQLCMSMQCSIWTVALPLIIVGYLAGVTVWVPSVVGHFADAALWFTGAWHPVLGWFVLLLGVFMYAMAVSGVALGFYNRIEYSATRYEVLLGKFDSAKAEIEGLRLALSQAEAGQTATATVSITPDEFRVLVDRLNRECEDIGCPHRRRACRLYEIKAWVQEWAGDDPARCRKVGAVFHKCLRHMVSYYREYSSWNTPKENEQLLVTFYEQVTASLNR